MINVAYAIKKILHSDDPLRAELATYPFVTGDPEDPAIFIRDVIPPDAKYPAMVINCPAAVNWSTFDARGYEPYFTVRAYDNKGESYAKIWLIGTRIFELLDRAELPLPAADYEEWGCYADPPAQMPDPDGYPGILVAVKARVLRKETI